ncbi:MAG: gamma-glutamyl-gamma-aminobutyrate hydrolase family protein [Candidatus Adiutrix sp.]|nr:gamma-glutamyl-gamma-aminobutyrate hydrolase family protein [Candidatus Adiutrix sp.]
MPGELLYPFSTSRCAPSPLSGGDLLFKNAAYARELPMTINPPLIGVTAANLPTPDWDGRLSLDRDGAGRLYAEAVARAGGLPVILPLTRPPLAPDEDETSAPGGCGPGALYANARIFLARLDGLLLSGGGDLAPPPGAAAAALCRGVDPARDVWEAALLAAALDADKPIVAICRGMQLMNVSLGGTLWTDLPSERPGEVAHEQKFARSRASHAVVIEPGSRLAAIFGQTEIMVNSGHHQGIKNTAAALTVAAHAPDGLIEALEHRAARFAVGVQWHPEGQAAAAPSRALFRAFVQAAAL